MTYRPKHILMRNFVPVSREYFDVHALPDLEAAAIRTAPIIKTYDIAGRKVRVHLYGAYVANTFPLALAHREIADAGDADLVIHAWDSSGAVAPLPAPWDQSDFKTFRQEKERWVKDGAFFGVYIGGEETLNFYDAKTKTGYFWTQDARMLPHSVLGAPFRTVLHWFLSESDIHLMHGAVIGENGSAVLITAKSGSGKSTTALSSLLAGMEYVSDDYAAVQNGSSITAHSLYNSGKVTREGLALFPELADKIWNKGFPDNEKAVIFMSEHFPEQVKVETALKAVLVPRISPHGTRIAPINKTEALLAIAPTTLLQLPFADAGKLTIFKDILEKIPCYSIELGPDIRNIPKAISDFLKTL